MAANRSRNGPTSWDARLDTGPEIATPTRNAPTAAETCNCSATPEITSVTPRTVSSNTSSDGLTIHRLTVTPCRMATMMTTATTTSATTKVAAASGRARWETSTAISGR